MGKRIMNKRILIILGSLTLALIGISFYLLTGGSESPADQAGSKAPMTADPTIMPGGTTDQGQLKTSPREVLVHYTNWAKYPPDSRPLLPGHTDVINHERVHLPQQDMAALVDGVIKKSHYACRLQPMRHTVTEGEAMRVQFYCTNEGRRVPVKVASFKLERRLMEKRWPTGGMTVGDSGQKGDSVAGDNIHTFHFKPKRSDWGSMFLDVKFTIPGDPLRAEYELKTSFFSSPVAPAKFTGRVREELRNGSLYLKVELNVRAPGRYTIEGNLMANDGPIAFARRDARLTKRGLTWVELEYFGKIFHDRGFAGPYKLVGLRGKRNNTAIDPDKLNGPPEQVAKYISAAQTTEPERQYMPLWSGKHETRAYQLKDFQDRVYDSEEKRARIKLLRGLIRDT